MLVPGTWALAALDLTARALFCLTLYRMQRRVRPDNRLLRPSFIWLDFLLHLGSYAPYVGIVVAMAGAYWDWCMVIRLGWSLWNEFATRDWDRHNTTFGRAVGRIWAVSHFAITPVRVAVWPLYWLVEDARLLLIVVQVVYGAVVLLWLVGTICWITYWVRMAGYGRQLRYGERGYTPGGIEEDFDDRHFGQVTPGREGPPPSPGN